MPPLRIGATRVRPCAPGLASAASRTLQGVPVFSLLLLGPLRKDVASCLMRWHVILLRLRSLCCQPCVDG